MPDERAYERAVVHDMHARHATEAHHERRVLDTCRMVYAPPGTAHDLADRCRWRAAHSGQVQHVVATYQATEAWAAHRRGVTAYRARLRQHRALLPGAPAAYAARALRRTASAGDPPSAALAVFAQARPHAGYPYELGADHHLLRFRRVAPGRGFRPLPPSHLSPPVPPAPLTPREAARGVGPLPLAAVAETPWPREEYWPPPVHPAHPADVHAWHRWGHPLALAPGALHDAARGEFPPVVRPQYERSMFPPARPKPRRQHGGRPTGEPA